MIFGENIGRRTKGSFCVADCVSVREMVKYRHSESGEKSVRGSSIESRWNRYTLLTRSDAQGRPWCAVLRSSSQVVADLQREQKAVRHFIPRWRESQIGRGCAERNVGNVQVP